MFCRLCYPKPDITNFQHVLTWAQNIAALSPISVCNKFNNQNYFSNKLHKYNQPCLENNPFMFLKMLQNTAARQSKEESKTIKCTTGIYNGWITVILRHINGSASAVRRMFELSLGSQL